MAYISPTDTRFVLESGAEHTVRNKVYQHRIGDPVNRENTDGFLHSTYIVKSRKVVGRYVVLELVDDLGA